MQMPGMGGFELTEEIKADAALASTQIIIMHTVGRRGSSASWAEAGISGYVTKPVKQSALLRRHHGRGDPQAADAAPGRQQRPRQANRSRPPPN